MQQKKVVTIGTIEVDEKVVNTLLKYEDKTFRQVFESISPKLCSLINVSRVLNKLDPIVRQIENSTKVSLDYITLFEKSLQSIPTGLTPSELMTNETIVERRQSRTRLKNMPLRGFIDVLGSLVHNLEEVIKLHNNPNILNKDTKIDDTDLLILMNKSVVLSDFERRSMHVSVGDVVTKTDRDGHGGLSTIFARKQENFEDKTMLTNFETLYDDVQNICSLAEDLLIVED